MMNEEQNSKMNEDQNSGPADPALSADMQSQNQPVRDGSAAGVVELEQRLSTCEAKASEYLEGWQRARAEFSNYKKRIERDQSQMQQSASTSIIKRYFEPLDDMERALKNRPQDGEGAAWANGIELIYRKMLNILEGEGVARMNPQGEYFDPNLHEAVTSEDSDEYESGQIIDVLQPGYLSGEKVLRPALVRVAR